MVSLCYFCSRNVTGIDAENALGCRDNAAFVASEQQERAAEHYFSKLRAKFSNGQLSVKDYIIASAALGRRSVAVFADLPKPAAGSEMHGSTNLNEWEKADDLAIRSASGLFARLSTEHTDASAKEMLKECIRIEKEKTGADRVRTEEVVDAERGDEQSKVINQFAQLQRGSKHVAQTNYPPLLCRKT